VFKRHAVRFEFEYTCRNRSKYCWNRCSSVYTVGGNGTDCSVVDLTTLHWSSFCIILFHHIMHRSASTNLSRSINSLRSLLQAQPQAPRQNPQLYKSSFTRKPYFLPYTLCKIVVDKVRSCLVCFSSCENYLSNSGGVIKI